MQKRDTSPTSLIPWLADNRQIRVAVIGDVILDEYWDGQVTRISPEAPVPVHLVTNTFHGAGGAANAARNIKLAGGDVMVFAVVGEDEAGRQLIDILKKDNIDCANIVAVDDRPTIRKTRITASSQYQLVRVDWERVQPIMQETQDRILKGLRDAKFDALLISDYGKGMLPISLLSNVIAEATKKGVPIIVDPKGRDFSKYLHATLITPNRKEACEALGLDPSGSESAAELGKRLQTIFGLQNILVTLGPKGMVLVPKDGPAIEMPSIAREVFDVSGAGDTVVAIMTMCMACKAPMQDAMHIANTAAAVVVGKWGTQPIQIQELEAALRQRPDPRHPSFSTQSKVTTRETLHHILKDPESRSKKVVFTNGCFDLLHAGHVEYLEAARSMGDLLVVGVNTDESVRKLKGSSRPLMTLDKRMRMLAALSCIDYVVPFGEETPLEVISFLVPDVLIKGADYDKNAAKGAKTSIVGSDVVLQAGGRVETVALVPGESTTALEAKIAKL